MEYFILIILLSFSINGLSSTKILITEKEIDLEVFLSMPYETCNEYGCFYPNKFYFIEDQKIECPQKSMKLAYKDQNGKYRVASLLNKSKRSVDSKIVENCQRRFSNRLKSKAVPKYMQPTLSSESKRVSKNTNLIRPVSTTTLQSNVILSEKMDSILTEDYSIISNNNFDTAKSFCSLDDMNYLKNKFPQNMFDDTGDIIYSSSLILSLLSLMGTIIKLILSSAEKKNMKGNLLKENNLNDFLREINNKESSKETSTPKKSNSYSIVLPKLVPQVKLQNENKKSNSKDFCFCKVGTCISGNCNCHKASRACTALCHGGLNNNCKANLNHYSVSLQLE